MMSISHWALSNEQLLLFCHDALTPCYFGQCTKQKNKQKNRGLTNPAKENLLLGLGDFLDCHKASSAYFLVDCHRLYE